MDHRDHVGLIRAGLQAPAGQEAPAGSEASPGLEAPPRLAATAQAGRRWLELGAGEGAFTLALADLLGPGAEIVALDRDASALRRLAEELPRRFPGRTLTTVVADFRDPLPAGPFDGVLAANSLHFVTDPVEVLRRVGVILRPGGRLIVVEYDADRGKPWVPHPFSSRRFAALATAAGFIEPRVVGRVPSRFLEAIYAAAADRPH
jgi:ubiquinone/menaquinone biosynthesis C-methylase UbiE